MCISDFPVWICKPSNQALIITTVCGKCFK